MKHRSTHIFILVAALLVAAPQASQELSDMKDALGGRLKAEIFNAFLSLQSVGGAPPAPAYALLAAADADAAKREGRQARAASPQVEVHARREVPAEAPSEVEPVVEIAALEAEVAEAVAPPAPALKFELHDTKVMRGRELSIIVPPDADFTAPPPRPARVAKAEERIRVAPRAKKEAELERAAAHLAARLEDVLEAKGLPREEFRRVAAPLRQLHIEVEADAARGLTKVMKLKRAAPKPAPNVTAPPARAACPRSAAAATTTSPLLACGPAEAQSFFVTE